jgi:hypothetical protein
MEEDVESAGSPGILRVLDYVLRLELTDARWERVDGILAIAVEAATSGDLGGLKEATNKLRAIGPVRIIRIGGAPVGPPPPKIREQEENLRRAVRGMRSAGPDNKDGGDDDQ